MKLTASQREAVEQRGSSVLVSASAGSGKTEVLARRCVGLIADPKTPCEVDRLLVVTFTRAAAAELRVRIARMLRERAETATDSKLRTHLRRQALLVDSAEIGTIDGFCTRTLREFFAEANVDPGFALLSAEEALLLRADVLDDVFDWIYTEDDPLALAARDWLRAAVRPGDEFLRGFVQGLNRFRDHLIDPGVWFARQQNAFSQKPSRLKSAALRMLAEALSAECRFQREQLGGLLRRVSDERVLATLTKYGESLAQWTQTLEDAPRLPLVLSEIGDERLSRPGGLKGADAALFDAVRERWLQARLQKRWARDDIEPIVEQADRAVRLMRTLLTLEARFEESLCDVKTQRGVLEFGDVLRKTLDLIGSAAEGEGRTPTPIALRLRERFEHILVDEYQDTSPLQVALLRLISRDQPGRTNRFMVGDVKQSIYGFREAEPRLFVTQAQAFASGAEEGRVIPLSDNFRSHADLVDGVNRIFSMLFDPALGGTAYGEDERLEARRDESPNATLDGQPRIRIHVHPKRGSRRSSEIGGDGETNEGELASLERIELEGLTIARQVHQLLDCGAQVPQRDADGHIKLRPLGLSDIVILLRSAKGNAPLIASTLRHAGIPCVAAGRESILDSREVCDLRNVLALLGNRLQDLAMAAYLRGPLNGLTARDLLSIRNATEAADFAAATLAYAREGHDDALKRKVRAALARLDEWSVLAREAELPVLVRTMLRESGLTFFAQALPGGEHRLVMLHAFEALIEEFARGGQYGLPELLHYLDTLDREGERPGAALTSGQDAVPIMTIHAAKGLEFPVVFLAGAGAPLARGGPSGLCCDEQIGVGLRFFHAGRRADVATPADPILRSAGQQREREEEMRLFYVAATRAREQLYIIGHAKPGLWDELCALSAGHAPPPLISRFAAHSVLEWALMGVASSGAHQAVGESHARVLVQIEGAEHELDGARPAATKRTEAPPELSEEDLAWVDLGRRRLDVEPDGRAAETPAVLSVTAMRRQAPEGAEPGGSNGRQGGRLGSPALADEEPRVDGQRIGNAYHRFLQHVDLAALSSQPAIEQERDRLVSMGMFDDREAALLDVGALAWFGQTELGRSLSGAPARCRRETPFVLAAQMDALDERQVIRGVIDCVIEHPDGLTLIDYKTDHISDESDLRSKTAEYAIQLRAYCRAAAQIFGRPVLRASLVFFSARQVVDVDCAPAAVDRALLSIGLQASAPPHHN